MLKKSKNDRKQKHQNEADDRKLSHIICLRTLFRNTWTTEYGSGILSKFGGTRFD